jgi:hypothetical protein
MQTMVQTEFQELEVEVAAVQMLLDLEKMEELASQFLGTQ